MTSLEDTHKGGNGGEYANGIGVSSEEGRYLYTLVRFLKPKAVLEIGCAYGHSANHILEALEANGDGVLHSVDIDPKSGSLISSHLRHRWNLIVGDIANVKLPLEQYDFVFEDSAHTYDVTKAALERADALQPRIVIMHDYYLHTGTRVAFRQVYSGNSGAFLMDDTNTGFGIWMK